jgi:16S rRNA (cytidine1402-2'-O)-methyltransferase
MIKTGTLYLIPHVLDDEAGNDFIPETTRQQVRHISHFIMESEKAGRALIKRLNINTPQANIQIQLCNEHTLQKDLTQLIAPLMQGFDVGLMSDAGTPCIADPGHGVVMACHKNGIKVVPLAGSSSIMLALMASGLGGQQFVFHGYLPIEKAARVKMMKEMEEQAHKKGYTQIFMEAPYRNNQLLKDIISQLKNDTLLTIACSLTSPNQLIETKKTMDWKLTPLPDLHKKPCLFLIR